MSTASLVSSEIDYGRSGLQIGTLRIPHSHNRSAYGFIPVPINGGEHGSGPTFLLTGANHGDEYEGALALMDLVRNLDLEKLNGLIIILPALNMPAYRAGGGLVICKRTLAPCEACDCLWHLAADA